MSSIILLIYQILLTPQFLLIYQYQAALAITGTQQGTSRKKLYAYDELGWESLSDRRWSRRLTQFYKIQNNMTGNVAPSLVIPILISPSRDI